MGGVPRHVQQTRTFSRISHHWAMRYAKGANAFYSSCPGPGSHG